MKSFDLKTEFTVPNKLQDDESEVRVELKFENIKSFTPEEVVKQVPQLNKMLAIRELLTGLRQKIVNTSQFRRRLEEIIKDEKKFNQLISELDKIVPTEAIS